MQRLKFPKPTLDIEHKEIFRNERSKRNIVKATSKIKKESRFEFNMVISQSGRDSNP